MVSDRFRNQHLYTPLGAALAFRELFTLQLSETVMTVVCYAVNQI